MSSSDLCPLCDRPLGDVNIDGHHLIPKTFKGKADANNKIPIHKVCHRKIHATLAERELLKTYHTWEALRSHQEIQDFIKWIAKKDPGYYSGTTGSNRKK